MVLPNTIGRSYLDSWNFLLPLNQPEPEESPLSDESEGVTMVFEPTVSNPVPAVQDEPLEEAEPGFEVEPAAVGKS